MKTSFSRNFRTGRHGARLLKISLLSAAAVLLVSLGFGSLELFAAENKTAKTTATGDFIHETSFNSDHDLTGLMASCSEAFYTGDWNYTDASLTLSFSSTQLARKEISDFTISLNGNHFYSSRLPDGQDEKNELSIPIPTYLLTSGINTVTIKSYIRTNESSDCADNISDATWMTIFKDSYVSVSYKPEINISTVADCYKQFTAIDALENSQSALFLGESPTDDELTAASYILSGVSANAVYDYQNIQLIRSSDPSLYADIRYGIYVSAWDNLPESIKASIPSDASSAADSGSGLIYLIKSNDQYILVVTGKDSAGFLNAARLFGNQALISQSLYDYRGVTADENVTFDWTKSNDDTLLTDTGTYLYGPFRQSTDYYVSRGSNLLVNSGSNVTINFRYAENLDFDRSMMTVYIGDTPIGSIKLSSDRANGDSATFNIPDNTDLTGTFTLKVAFDLEIKDLPCTMRSEEMPWAYITPESSLHLETSESPYLLFDYYPAPFVYNGRLNAVRICIPDAYSDSDLKVMSDIALTFGRYMKDNSGDISVTCSSSSGDLSGSNIVSIGKYDSNPIAQKFNDELFFRFSSDGSTFVSNEKKNIDADYGTSLGTGQLLYSPYGKKDHAFLLISGINDDGMLNADRYLGDSSMVYNIAGDGFVADADDVYYYRFKADNSKTGSLLSKVMGNPQLLILIVTSLVVILIIVIYLILRTVRNRRELK